MENSVKTEQASPSNKEKKRAFDALLISLNNGGTLIIQDLLIKDPNLALLLAKDTRLNINLTDAKGYSFLIMAAEHGDHQVVAELLQREKINVNAATQDGSTALIMASQHGHHQVVAELLQREKINVNAATQDGSTALIMASQHGHHQVVAELLKRPEINVNASQDSSTALIMASRHGHHQVVAELLQRPDINVNFSTLAALMMSVRHNQILTEHLNNVSSFLVNDTALIIAVKQGHHQTVDELLKHPEINVNIADSKGKTALIIAVKQGHHQTVDKLLKHPEINVNIADSKGKTALIIAVKQGHHQTVDELLKHPLLDIDMRLILAIALERYNLTGETDIVSKLVKHPKFNVFTLSRDNVRLLNNLKAAGVKLPFTLLARFELSIMQFASFIKKYIDKTLDKSMHFCRTDRPKYIILLAALLIAEIGIIAITFPNLGLQSLLKITSQTVQIFTLYSMVLMGSTIAGSILGFFSSEGVVNGAIAGNVLGNMFFFVGQCILGAISSGASGASAAVKYFGILQLAFAVEDAIVIPLLKPAFDHLIDNIPEITKQAVGIVKSSANAVQSIIEKSFNVVARSIAKSFDNVIDSISYAKSCVASSLNSFKNLLFKPKARLEISQQKDQATKRSTSSVNTEHLDNQRQAFVDRVAMPNQNIVAMNRG